MSDLRKLLTDRSLTNAQARLLNWMMLVLVVVAWTAGFFVAGERTATSLVAVSASIYSGSLLLVPLLARWGRFDGPVERERAWLVGLAGYGGLGLFLMLRTTMLALFG